MFRIFGRGPSAPAARKKKRRDPRRATDPTATLEKFVVEEIEIPAVPDRVATGPQPRRYAAWRPALRRAIAHTGFWLMLLLAGLFSRSLWPVDETRFAAIAWEMWRDGRWLLPAMNGGIEPVAPLYSWLTVLGWKFFGPVAWWPRLLPALFGFGALLLVGRLARLMWPDEVLIRQYAPMVTLGTFFFAAFMTLALPMMLLVFFALLAWWAQLVMWRARDARAWLLLGAALGGGLLAHGPIAYIYILSPALLAPMWVSAAQRPAWGAWYRDVIAAIVMGSAILAVWLVPATIKSGTAVTLSFLKHAGAPPLADWFVPGTYVWWYLLLVPLVFLPWFVWPLPWLRLFFIRREPTDPGIAFCVTATVPAIVVLSLFSAKNLVFLLPLIPAGALMITYLLLKDDLLTVHQDSAVAGMTVPLILIGCLLAIVPKLPRVDFLPQLLWDLSPFVGVGVVLVGVALAFLPMHEIRQRVQNLAVLSVTSVVIALLALGAQLDPLLRVDETATFLSAIERQKRPIAIIGPYAGAYHYAGRLKEPIQVLAPADVHQWRAWHPRGVLVSASDRWQPRTSGGAPLHESQRLGSTVRAWDAATLTSSAGRTGSGGTHRQ